MGVGVGDYDLNGELDIVKTHFQGDMPGLYHNEGKGDFVDVTIRAGLGVETQYICWGTGFCDLDNDGFPDIFMVAGGVYPEVERKFPNIPMAMPRLLFRNLGNGSFEELSSMRRTGSYGSPLQPRMRFWRFRQRWRHGYRRIEPE